MIKVAAIGAALRHLGNYDFGPFDGALFWTLYVFRLGFHVESWQKSWLFGLLLAAITEAAIGCALAAFSWWFYQRLSLASRTQRGLSRLERYGISFACSACILGIANNLQLWRPVSCYDCFFPHGLPFTFYHEGGFAGGEGFVWLGILGNTLTAVILAGASGFVWSWISRTHSVKPATN